MNIWILGSGREGIRTALRPNTIQHKWRNSTDAFKEHIIIESSLSALDEVLPSGFEPESLTRKANMIDRSTLRELGASVDTGMRT